MSTKRPSVSTLSELIQKYQGTDWDTIKAIDPRLDALEDLVTSLPDVIGLVELVPEIEALLANPSGTFVNAPLLDYPVDYTAEGFPAANTLGAILAAFAELTKDNEALLEIITDSVDLNNGYYQARYATGTSYLPLGGNFPVDLDNVSKVLDSLKQTFPISGRVLLVDETTTLNPYDYTTVGIPYNLTNDGASTDSDTSQAVLGREIFWNFTTNSFDFNSFNLGDVLTLRIDLEVATSIVNQEVDLRLRLADGSLVEFTKVIDISRYPVIESNRIIKEITFIIDRPEIINNVGYIEFRSDANADITTNSFELFYQVKDEI
jgi:hypothetical protein